MKSVPATDQPTASERRQFHRRLFQGMMEIEWGAEVLTATVRDIGPRGLFAELTPPLWIGAAFSARLLLNPALKLNCTVCRVDPGKGIAVEFDVPEETGRHQLEMLLETLPQL